MTALRIILKPDRSVLLLVLAALLIGCGDSPTEPTQQGYYLQPTPMENGEAEAMAYFLSGELTAPTWLYKQIRTELDIIRTEWSNSVPQVKITYYPYLLPSCLIAEFEPSTIDSIKAGTYHAWDDLNERYRVDPAAYSYLYNYVSFRFHGRLNPNRLVEIYKGLPGMRSLETNCIGIIDGPNLFVQKKKQTMKYFFKDAWGDCPSGCMTSKFYYFSVREGTPVFHGSWKWPPDNPEDTVLQPAWVDTAMQAAVEYCKSASWRRDTSLSTCYGEARSMTSIGIRDYIDEGMRILELAQQAHSLYVSQTPQEKNKLLRCVLSNSVFDGVNLSPTYKKPFDLIIEGLEKKRARVL